MREAELTDLPETVRTHYQSLYPELADKLKSFDVQIYFASNPDVARAAGDSDDLVRHFCEFGHRECRLYAVGITYQALYAQAFPELADRLKRFDPVEYRRANRDVGDSSSDDRACYEHFRHDGAKTLRALRPDSRVIDRCEAITRMTGRTVEADIRVFAHLFFPDVGEAVAPYLKNLAALGARTSIAFSAVTFAPREMELYAASVSGEDGVPAKFVMAPPEGRDWGGLHRLWLDFPPSDTSTVFFVHSKKSLHMAPIAGEMWRNELLGPLCGSYGAVLTALSRLQEGYSMVGSALHRTRNIGPSRDLIVELLPQLGLTCNIDETDFVGGTMFAIRGEVLNEFFWSLSAALDFSRKICDAELFDGTMAHACERLIGYFAASRGKGIAWVL